MLFSDEIIDKVMVIQMDSWSFKPRDLVTVPNLITYFRFILVPPFIYFFINEQFLLAGIMIGLSGLSDCFDGFFARKLNQVTSLGKILDPIADKVTLVAVAVCMVIYIPSILPIMLVLVGKEFLMLLGGFIMLLRKMTPPPANIFGKIATLVFYFVISLIIFIKIVTGEEYMPVVIIGLILVAVAMLLALVQYAVMFVKINREKNSAKS